MVGQAGQTLLASTQQGPQHLTVRWQDDGNQHCQVAVNPQNLPLLDGFRMQTLQCLPVSVDDTKPASADDSQEHA